MTMPKTLSPGLLPAYAMRVLSALEDAGWEAWIVGGWVRDALRGDPAHDVDMASNAPWKKSEQALREAGINVHETGTAHGTITAVVDDKPIEITTYRTESTYSDFRHPDSVTFVDTIEQDLSRRDFTINAMAWHPIRGLKDPFGGRKDLAAGIIRAVGDPQKRFHEDALRILRAVRFAARYSFVIDPETQQALEECSGELALIASERIGQELNRILESKRLGWALKYERIVLRAAVSELAKLSKQQWEVLCEEASLIEALAGGLCPQTLRWAALFSQNTVKEAQNALKRMAQRTEVVAGVEALLMENEADADLLERKSVTREKVLNLVSELERMSKGSGFPLSFQLVELWQARSIVERWTDERRKNIATIKTLLTGLCVEKLPLKPAELVLSGCEAMELLKLEPGPKVGNVMNEILHQVTAGAVSNNHDELVSFVRNHAAELTD